MLYFCLAAAASFSISNFFGRSKADNYRYKQPVWKSYCMQLQYKSLPGNSSRNYGEYGNARCEWTRKQHARKQHAWNSKQWVLYVTIVIHKQLNYRCHVLSPPKQVSNAIKKWDHEDSMAIRQTASLYLQLCLRPTYEEYIMQYCHVTNFFSSETRSPLTNGGCWVVDNHIALVLVNVIKRNI